MATDVHDLLMRYDEWDQDRTILSEMDCDPDGCPPSSSRWEDSDDEAASLAHDLAEALRRLVDE